MVDIEHGRFAATKHRLRGEGVNTLGATGMGTYCRGQYSVHRGRASNGGGPRCCCVLATSWHRSEVHQGELAGKAGLASLALVGRTHAARGQLPPNMRRRAHNCRLCEA